MLTSRSHASPSVNSGPSNYSVITVESNAATSYTLQHLEKNTWYEVDIQPYHKDFVGEESNSIRVRTLEDGKMIQFVVIILIHIS